MLNSLFTGTSGLSLGKIISGISSTLSITNKALPIIKQAGPIINNLKSTYSTFINNKDKITIIENKKESTTINNKIIKAKKETSNLPVFFQ